MVYNLFTYRRPARVSSSRLSVLSEKAESVSSGSSSAYGIPDALSFEKIINGGTCPPCTLRDFMEYVYHIEHNAENLQFFLWYRDYVKRFEALPENERALAPQWTIDVAEAQALALQTSAVGKRVNPEIAAILKGTDFGPKSKVAMVEVNGNPFNTPPRTPAGEKDQASVTQAPSEAGLTDDMSTLNGHGVHQPLSAVAAGAFNNAEHLQPFTIQPFREEISRIIGIYIAEDGVRQLNLSAKERTALLHALANTTHPSAFKNVISTVEWTLRHQAHPMFVRYSICNGNRPRVIFARGLGIGGIVLGLFFAIIITLSTAGRGWRALSGICFLIGISTLFAAWKGMCVVLHGMHHRHVRPWELFQDAETYKEDGFDMSKGSFDSMGSVNSYEDEPWIAKYEQRNAIRKIFDRELWIQEPALRQIQDTIFLQAILVSVGLSAVCVGIFVAIPRGDYFSW